jgi:hypothetical protein
MKEEQTLPPADQLGMREQLPGRRCLGFESSAHPVAYYSPSAPLAAP